MIKKIINNIKSNNLLASFSILASGSVIAQLITMLVSPIITRLYSPEDMGNYTLIVTAVSIFGPVISLKYDMAILLVESEKELKAILRASGLISIILSIIIGTTYNAVVLDKKIGYLNILFYIIVTIILLIAYGVNNILLAFNNKNGQYKLISSVTMIKSFANSFVSIIGGIFKLEVYGLLIAQLFSYSAGIKQQAKGLMSRNKKEIKIGKSDLKEVLIKYKNQPIYNAPSALVTTTVYSSINLFVKIVYSVEQLGLYSLSYKVLGIPFTVISANIARIFYDFALKEKKEKNSFNEIFLKTLFILAITTIPLLIFIAIISPTIFSLVFGTEWFEAGIYVRYMTPMFAIRLITDSLTTSFIISGRQNLELFFQVTLLIGEFIIFIISGVISIELKVSLLLISLLYLIVYGIMLFKMYALSKNLS